VKDTFDIVYPIGKKCAWGNYEELRYSLRSLKYVSHGTVWIVGVKPDWCVNVKHIPFSDSYVCKDANMISKILRVCCDGVSDEFIRLSDDQLFLKPYKGGYYYDGLLKNGESAYSHIAQNTKDLLLREGRTIFNFDTHCPQIISKKYADIMLRCPFGEGVGVLVNSFYFNSLGIEPTEVNMLRVKGAQDTYNFDKDFLNYNDSGLTEGLKKKIMEFLPEKSRYEI